MPPLATAKVPASVIVPDVVTGPPLVVSPVVPPETSMEVTVVAHWKALPDHSKKVLAPVGSTMNEVVPEPVLNTIWFAPPPAMFVAVLTEMLVGSLH